MGKGMHGVDGGESEASISMDLPAGYFETEHLADFIECLSGRVIDG